MARKARIKSETGIYHIMLRGINKQDIFLDDEDYRKFLKTLNDCKKKSHFELYAYCLMSNHIHLLLKENENDISTIIKQIACSYVYWFNRKYERVGHLFQDRFRSEPVDNDEYFLTVLRYIHQNPVKAKIAAQCDDYLYSSYKLYFIDTVLIDKEFTFSIINKDYYREFHSMDTSDVCLDIPEAPTIINDVKAKNIFLKLIQDTDEKVFSSISPEKQIEIVKRMKGKGLSIPQIVKLTELKKSRVDKIIYLLHD